MISPQIIQAPGIEVLRLDPDAALDISLRPASPTLVMQGSIDSRWAELCAGNPKFHDGEIVAVADWRGASIECRCASFRELAVQPEVPTECELLAVTAVVSALGHDGLPRILVGRRHRQTRVYGGLWELGPSGGVSPPDDDVLVVGTPHLLRQVETELDEEAGLPIAGAHVTIAGIIRDLAARSLDIVYRVALPTPLADLVPGARDWEYEEVRWLTLEEAMQAVTTDPGTFIPPAQYMLQRRNWLVCP